MSMRPRRPPGPDNWQTEQIPAVAGRKLELAHYRDVRPASLKAKGIRSLPRDRPRRRRRRPRPAARDLAGRSEAAL